jgi:hypothetical protein
MAEPKHISEVVNPLMVLLDIKTNYEAVKAIYENMPIEDLRKSYSVRTGWEKELIKVIGIERAKLNKNG